MEKTKTYCEFVAVLEPTNKHKIYHDTKYGFPVEKDDELFERLVLEINQAGLNWGIILQKQENFRKAFHQFDIQKVANYDEKEIQRLLNDAGIIRNRLKINATIYNAKVILSFQQEFGSFKQWLDHHHPKTKKEWVKLFAKYFKFTGGEIVNEFLMSIGYLEGSHTKDCPVYEKIILSNPAFKNSIK